MDEEMASRSPEDVFVERVRFLRRDRGWTLEDMGRNFELAGYGAGSRQAMMQLEAGEVKRLTLTQVHAAAIAFGVPPLALLATEDPMTPIEITPGTSAPLSRFTEWWRAERPLDDDKRSEGRQLVYTPGWLDAELTKNKTQKLVNELNSVRLKHLKTREEKVELLMKLGGLTTEGNDR